MKIKFFDFVSREQGMSRDTAALFFISPMKLFQHPNMWNAF